MAAPFSDPRVQRFLATKHVVVLATVRPDGGPMARAMWFVYGPDDLTMISVAATPKVEHLRRDPRVCVVAETGTTSDIRNVTVLGRAVFLEDSPERRGLVERFHAKYSPALERLWRGRAMPPDRVMFRIVPERVLSHGLGDS
jgi:PPOX class probable F420-dependent enzyme